MLLISFPSQPISSVKKQSENVLGEAQGRLTWGYMPIACYSFVSSKGARISEVTKGRRMGKKKAVSVQHLSSKGTCRSSSQKAITAVLRILTVEVNLEISSKDAK